jgi:hypothetical protein
MIIYIVAWILQSMNEIYERSLFLPQRLLLAVSAAGTTKRSRAQKVLNKFLLKTR